jgi:hypothetical protein
MRKAIILVATLALVGGGSWAVTAATRGSSRVAYRVTMVSRPA